MYDETPASTSNPALNFNTIDVIEGLSIPIDLDLTELYTGEE